MGKQLERDQLANITKIMAVLVSLGTAAAQIQDESGQVDESVSPLSWGTPLAAVAMIGVIAAFWYLASQCQKAKKYSSSLEQIHADHSVAYQVAKELNLYVPSKDMNAFVAMIDAIAKATRIMLIKPGINQDLNNDLLAVVIVESMQSDPEFQLKKSNQLAGYQQLKRLTINYPEVIMIINTYLQQHCGYTDFEFLSLVDTNKQDKQFAENDIASINNALQAMSINNGKPTPPLSEYHLGVLRQQAKHLTTSQLAAAFVLRRSFQWQENMTSAERDLTIIKEIKNNHPVVFQVLTWISKRTTDTTEAQLKGYLANLKEAYLDKCKQTNVKNPFVSPYQPTKVIKVLRLAALIKPNLEVLLLQNVIKDALLKVVDHSSHTVMSSIAVAKDKTSSASQSAPEQGTPSSEESNGSNDSSSDSEAQNSQPKSTKSRSRLVARASKYQEKPVSPVEAETEERANCSSVSSC